MDTNYAIAFQSHRMTMHGIGRRNRTVNGRKWKNLFSPQTKCSACSFIYDKQLKIERTNRLNRCTMLLKLTASSGFNLWIYVEQIVHMYV